MELVNNATPIILILKILASLSYNEVELELNI